MHAAVVGTGFIGPVHVEALRRAGVVVKGILGSQPEKTRIAAESLGLSHAYESYDELLADAEVDAVHITTPNRYHFEQATAALKAGKHVMCEKPLAMNSSQTQSLVELAKECHLAAGVCYNIRFYPLCHHAASMFQNYDCGQFVHVNGSYVQDWLLKETDFNWRVLSEDGGELRAVADIGTHWLDLVQFIVGHKVTRVFADLNTVFEQRLRPEGGVETFSGGKPAADDLVAVNIDTEDCGSVLLKFDNGATGNLWVSQMTAGRKNCLRFEMGGTQSSISWNSQSPNEMWIGHRDQPNQSLLRDPALLGASAAEMSHYPGGHNEGFPDTFKQLFRSFYDYIGKQDFTQSPAFPTFQDGHYEVLICEAILQSHRQQQWVDVAPVQESGSGATRHSP